MAPMLELAAVLFVDALQAYYAIGLLFALCFVSIGAQRVDSQAAGAGLGFRLLILPGVAAIWPLLLYRWMGGSTETPAERNPHR